MIINTQTDNPYQIGADLYEMAGGRTPGEFGDNPHQTANEAAAWLTKQGVTLVDYDGAQMDMAQYIERYLSQG